MKSMSVAELAQWKQQQHLFLLLDVRREQAVSASGVQIEGAQWKNPALWLDWKDTIPKQISAVVYCAHGREISQGLTAALLVLGVDAAYLEGGISALQNQGQPLNVLSK